jgi:hypothetical protein
MKFFVSMYFTDGITYENSLLEKLSLIIYSLLINHSVINLPMDLQTDKACQKKIYPLHSVGKSIGEFNILLTRKPYVILLVFLFFHRYIYQ